MRAAAILGPGNLAKPRKIFQRLTGAEWTSVIEQADVAVLFGGDGTVHRHLAELAELEIPLLVVPCGSGNDFARALKIRNVKAAANAWHRFARGNSKPSSIDLGMISAPRLNSAREQPSPRMPPYGMTRAHSATGNQMASDTKRCSENSAVAVLSDEVRAEPVSLPQPPQLFCRYFCCVAGVGIDTEIARRASELPKWLRAHGGYALSAPAQFLRFAPFPMKLSLNGNDGTFHPTILAAVANAPAYGGGMKIAPRANLSDGKLDICTVRDMNAFKLFCLFPTVYFGRHLGFEEVEYEQAECVRIETEIPLDVFADGDYVCQTPVEFSVARGALKVIVPT